MRRRDFIKVLAGSAAIWPRAARAQQLPMVGFLHAGSAAGYAKEAAGFEQGLRETGYVVSRNVVVEYRWADGQYDHLPDLMADLVHNHAAVIAAAPFPAAIVAKEAAQAVPVVFEVGADPIRFGLVASLNRPGGNVTGVVNLSSVLVAKRIELMHELVPSATSIALVSDPGNPASETVINDAKKAETSLGIQIYILEAHTLSEIETAFTRAAELQAGAIVFSVSPVFTSNWQQIAALATRYRMPTGYEHRDFTRAGGLISYGADLVDAYRLTGVYVGQILHGAKPAELPVQQSTKIEMVINLKTAKALGITVPLPLSGRADELIE